MSDKTNVKEEVEQPEVRAAASDSSGVSRRGFVKGGIAAIGAFIAGTAVGGFAVSTYGRAKAYVTKRIGSLYDFDATYAVRKSHENKELIDLYKDYLSPGAVLPAYTELSHRLCHTVYGDAIPAHIEELKSTTVEEAKKEAQNQMANIPAHIDQLKITVDGNQA